MILFESSAIKFTFAIPIPIPTPIDAIWGPEDDFKAIDGVSLFETEIYVSKIYGGHSDGKTFLFKRYIFLKYIGETNVVKRLIAAIKIRPLLFYYFYLL